MGNGQKAIMIGVGLFLTILIVSIVLLVTNLGITTITNASDQVANIDENLQNQLIVQYDRMAITGQDVVNIIQQNIEKLNGNIFVETVEIDNDTWNTAYRISNSGITANKIVSPTSDPPTYYAVAPSGFYINLVSLGDSSTKEELIDTVNKSKMYIGYLVRDKISMDVIGILFRFKT